MLKQFSSTSLILSFLLFAGPLSTSGQDLRYARTTRMEFGGTVGRVLNAVPAENGPSVETTFLKGNRIRRDEDDSVSTILNWDNGVLTTLLHTDRTFFEVNLLEVAEVAATAAEAMEAGLEGSSSETPGELREVAGAVVEGAEAAAQETEREYREGGGDQYGLEVVAESARTGRREMIGGYSAEQVLITLELKAAKDMADWQAEDTQSGLAIVTEVWLSTDFPEYQIMQQMEGEALDQLKDSRTEKGLLGSLEYLLSYDPRIKFAFNKNQETIDSMDGIPLRTVMHFVTLPDEARLDRDRALAEQDLSLVDDARGAAEESVKDAARSAVRGLSGRFFGRKEEAQPQPVVEEAEQQVFLRVISEIGDVDTENLPESLFEVPAEYQASSTATGN